MKYRARRQPRRRVAASLVKVLAGIATAAVLWAETMVRPDPSRAGLGDCNCLYYVPEGYTCAGGTLYLVGAYFDCYAHILCKVEWIAVGCCNG